jgi:hypothetical protein
MSSSVNFDVVLAGYLNATLVHLLVCCLHRSLNYFLLPVGGIPRPQAFKTFSCR